MLRLMSLSDNKITVLAKLFGGREAVERLHRGRPIASKLRLSVTCWFLKIRPASKPPHSGARASCSISGAERLKAFAAASRSENGLPSLFNQVIFRAAAIFRCLKDALPIGFSFAKTKLRHLFRLPATRGFLQM